MWHFDRDAEEAYQANQTDQRLFLIRAVLGAIVTGCLITAMMQQFGVSGYFEDQSPTSPFGPVMLCTYAGQNSRVVIY